jgi:hypothetical protein
MSTKPEAVVMGPPRAGRPMGIGGCMGPLFLQCAQRRRSNDPTRRRSIAEITPQGGAWQGTSSSERNWACLIPKGVPYCGASQPYGPFVFCFCGIVLGARNQLLRDGNAGVVDYHVVDVFGN